MSDLLVSAADARAMQVAGRRVFASPDALSKAVALGALVPVWRRGRRYFRMCDIVRYVETRFGGF